MPNKAWWSALSKQAADKAYRDVYAAQASLEVVKRAAVKLFVVRKGHRGPVQLASGVLFAIQNHVFILTAAHVIEGLHHNSLAIPINDIITPIYGDSYRTPLPKSGTHTNDPVDAAVFAIHPECSAPLLSQCASLEDLCPVERAFDVAYWVYGFPLMWGKPVRDGFLSNYRCMTIGGLSHDIYERIGFKTDEHILMERNKRVSTTAGMKAQRATLGMSGSGAWILPTHHGANLPPKLAGILIEKAKGWPAFVAVSIRTHMEMILRFNPDLGKDFDEWTTSESIHTFQHWLEGRGDAPSIPQEQLEQFLAKKLGMK